MNDDITVTFSYAGHDVVEVTLSGGGIARHSSTMTYEAFEDQVSKVHTQRMTEATNMFNLPWSMDEELPRLLPWAVHLPDTERAVMLKELAEAVAESPASWAQCLLEWQRTAEVWADPALRRSLIDRTDDITDEEIKP